jgi:hypothetical protein
LPIGCEEFGPRRANVKNQVTMNKKDISTSLTHYLSGILEDCRRIEPALQGYLKTSDERPNSNFELLRILSKALAQH